MIPNLLVKGVPQAIRKSPALKAYFVNLMSQPGETTATTTAAGVGGGLITFAVPPLAAAKITVASGVYLTLVPQFLDPDGGVAGQIAVLAAAHVAVAVTWLTACVKSE